jgi:D-lactate dehydrogenase
MGLAPKLRSLADAIADEVQVPIRATCCGMAGDRGLLHPELPRSATADQAAELEDESVLLALERATR